MAKKRIQMNTSTFTLEEVFPRFLTAKAAEGVSEKTQKTYQGHFFCIGKHLNLRISFDDLTKEHLDLLVVSMRKSGLSHNSISSYMRVMRTFIKWSREQGYTSLVIPNIRDKETVKETYTDDELEILLKKPSNNCDFTEYRNWVIVNFLMNCGCRAATIRNIRNCDVDITSHKVLFRHTKTGKVQLIPLCGTMSRILAEYKEIRGGSDDDYLFSNEYGEMMSENALRCAIARYNKRRGVQKTSIHLFRHTFARKYLIDCGGDAFTLQRLLGHSTLDMTKHYCNLYDTDIAKNYDQFSPLAQMNKPRERIVKRR